MPEKTTSLEQTQVIPATPAAVYEALVDPVRHAAFTGAEATGDPVEGEMFTAWDGYIEGRHLTLEPGRRIVQEWTTAEWPAGQPPSRLEFRLEACAEGTRLTLTHSDIPESQADSYGKGWIEYYWKPLRRYFEREG